MFPDTQAYMDKRAGAATPPTSPYPGPVNQSLSENLNEAAQSAERILLRLNEAHRRLFGQDALPTKPEPVSDNAQPNVSTLASFLVGELAEIESALQQHHNRI